MCGSLFWLTKEGRESQEPRLSISISMLLFRIQRCGDGLVATTVLWCSCNITPVCQIYLTFFIFYFLIILWDSIALKQIDDVVNREPLG